MSKQMSKQMSEETRNQPNKFTHNDKALAVRVINSDGTSYGGFENPTEIGEVVRPEKWVNDEECGNGIHCWPWGISRDGKEFAGDKIWQVVEILGESVMLDSKCKAESVKIVYSGNEAEAMRLTSGGRIAYLQSIGELSSSNTGDYSSSSNTGYHSSSSNTGYRSSSSNTGYQSSSSNTGDDSSSSNIGYRSSSSNTGYQSSSSNTGDYSSSSNTGDDSSSSNTGYQSSSSNTGDYSSSSNTGDYSLSSNTGYGSSSSNTGKSSLSAAIGLYSRVKGGLNGVIVLSYEKGGEVILECAKVDGINILPDVWYELDNEGKFVQVGRDACKS
jgi:hypothetical protein